MHQFEALLVVVLKDILMRVSRHIRDELHGCKSLFFVVNDWFLSSCFFLWCGPVWITLEHLLVSSDSSSETKVERFYLSTGKNSCSWEHILYLTDTGGTFAAIQFDYEFH